MLEALNIRFVDILDVLLVGYLIYKIIKIVRGTSAMNIVFVVLALYVTWIVVKALDMRLLSFMLGQILGGGVIAILIIFQQDVRRFLLNIGNRFTPMLRKGLLGRIFGSGNQGNISPQVLEEITGACRWMSEKHIGALLVMRRSNSLGEIIETGDEIHATISRRLLENIFFKNAPLHDGAVVMSQTQIIAARCTLPMSQSTSLPPHYGMRHRAALGISEMTDALAVVVSEETGEIWVAEDGKYQVISSITELRRAIEKSYGR